MKMTFIRITIFAFVMGWACGIAQAADPILMLDFNDTTANTAAETEPGYTPFTLNDIGSTINGVTISIVTDPGDHDRRRGTPTGVPLEQIYRDFIFARAAGMTIILSGLEADTIYEISLWAFDTGSGSSPPREAIWTANGQPLFVTSFDGTVLPTGADDYRNDGVVISDESGTIVMQSSLSPGSGHTTIYSFLNALIVTKADQCLNFPPMVTVDDFPVVDLADSGTVQLDVTVDDDGKPYQEGCNPDQPDIGTPIGLSYAWSVVSGPGTVTFDDDTSAAPMATFTEKGGYEIQVIVADGPTGPNVTDGKETTATFTVRVKNFSEDDFLLAHWAFEEGSGSTANDSALPNDLGTLASLPDAEDPNWVTGWVGNSALEFGGQSYVEITPAPDGPDPNLTDLEWEITVATWARADGLNNQWNTLVAKGVDTWRIMREGTSNTAAFHVEGSGGPQTSANGSININDGNWHHIVGTYDGVTANLYVDGRLDVSVPATSGLITVNDDPVWIGDRSDSAENRGWVGLIDDVRIYTYALSPGEIEQLALAGQNVIPVIEIADPCDMVVGLDNTLQLNATITDLNQDPLTITWTSDDPCVTFTDPAVEDVEIVVLDNKTGLFTVTVTVDDGTAIVSEQVQFNSFNPTCEEIINVHGLQLTMDFNADCVVNLEDFALFATEWMRCYDLQQQSCPNPENPFEW